MSIAKSKNKFGCVRTQADAAKWLKVSLATIQNWAKQGMPGRKGCYCVPDIIDWARTVGPYAPKPVFDAEDDGLLSGGSDSPALEACRRHKASLLELELEQKRGNVISRDAVRGILLRWATIWKRKGEWLLKRCGNDAAIAVNDAISECQNLVDHELGDPTTDTNPEK